MTLSKLKFDLAQKGLRCILKSYQVEIIRYFWNMQFWDDQIPMDSRTVHEQLLSAEVEGARSRASVITFLNWMVDEGFLDYDEKTTKGGIKRVYRLNDTSRTEELFRLHVSGRFKVGLLKFERQDEN